MRDLSCNSMTFPADMAHIEKSCTVERENGTKTHRYMMTNKYKSCRKLNDV